MLQTKDFFQYALWSLWGVHLERLLSPHKILPFTEKIVYFGTCWGLYILSFIVTFSVFKGRTSTSVLYAFMARFVPRSTASQWKNQIQGVWQFYTDFSHLPKPHFPSLWQKNAVKFDSCCHSGAMKLFPNSKCIYFTQRDWKHVKKNTPTDNYMILCQFVKFNLQVVSMIQQ